MIFHKETTTTTPPTPMTLCNGALGMALFQRTMQRVLNPVMSQPAEQKQGSKPSHMHPLPVTQEGRVQEEGGEYFRNSSTKLWRTLNMLKKSIIEFCHSMLLIKHEPGKENVLAFSHDMKKILNITVSTSKCTLTEGVVSQWASSFPKMRPDNVYVEEKWNYGEQN